MSHAGSLRALSGGAPARCRPTPLRSAARAPRLSAALFFAILTWAQGRLGATPAPPQHEVKAEFIERFTRFIDWPDSAFASPAAPFVVCAWGQSPLTTQLEQVVSRGRIKQRAVRLMQVESRDRLQACHILYVASRDRAVVRGIVASTRGRPVLSVGDQPGLAEEGLLINLFLDADGYVRFEVNLEATRVSGLKVSAKLMRLARLVGARK